MHRMMVRKYPKKTLLMCEECGVIWPCLEAQLNAIEKGKIKESHKSEYPN